MKSKGVRFVFRKDFQIRACRIEVNHTDNIEFLAILFFMKIRGVLNNKFTTDLYSHNFQLLRGLLVGKRKIKED